MAVNSADCVVAFDPLPQNIDPINKMITLNLDLNIQLCPIALGNKDGVTTFNVMPESSMGKLRSSSFQGSAESVDILKVEIKTLDTLAFSDHFSPPDLIRIDVEGAELQVLQGGERLLRSHHPTLIIECHSKSLAFQCNQYLSALSYQATVLETQQLLDQSLDLDVCHLIARYHA